MQVPSGMLFWWSLCEAWWSALVCALLWKKCNVPPYKLSYKQENEMNCPQCMWENGPSRMSLSKNLSKYPPCAVPHYPHAAKECRMCHFYSFDLSSQAASVHACIWLRLVLCRKIEVRGERMCTASSAQIWSTRDKKSMWHNTFKVFMTSWQFCLRGLFPPSRHSVFLAFHGA